MSAAIMREMRAVEQQLEEADAEYDKLSKQLRNVTQERQNTAEELMASNVRLKQLLGFPCCSSLPLPWPHSFTPGRSG